MDLDAKDDSGRDARFWAKQGDHKVIADHIAKAIMSRAEGVSTTKRATKVDRRKSQNDNAEPARRPSKDDFGSKRRPSKDDFGSKAPRRASRPAEPRRPSDPPSPRRPSGPAGKSGGEVRGAERTAKQP